MPSVPDTPANRARATAILRAGEVVAYPTDTLYGLGAIAFNEDAVRKVLALKGRLASQGVPLLIASVAQLPDVARDVPAAGLALAERFWPGALTLVVWRHPRVPLLACAGDTVAVRVPAHATPRDLINSCGAAITGTSANVHGGPSPTTAAEVVRQLPALSLVLDGGPCPDSVPSTIVDVTVGPPRLLRQGAVTLDQLRQVCPITGGLSPRAAPAPDQTGRGR